ncbi:ABC transporter ATP-binding protein/permease [Patescibacteria group bacterium]|nr:ABC transporter ATP-binding protein/permease [Patescibacteria group bacterium]
MHREQHSVIHKLISLLRGIHIHPAYLLIPIAFSLLSAVFEGAGLGLLVPILNGFLQKSFAFITDVPVLGNIVGYLPESILQNDRFLFGIILSGFLVVYILKNILRYLSIISMGYFGERALHHLRKVLFGRYLSFGKLYFDTSNVGHHNTLLLEFSRQSISPVLLIDKLINAIFSLTVYFVVLITISWKLTLVALPLFVILHFSIKFMITRIKGLSRAIAKRGSELGKKSVEILSTIPLVKSYRTEKKERDIYSDISNEKAKLDFQVKALQNLILPIQEIITIIVAALVLMGSLYLFGRDQIASAPALLVYFYIILNASSKFGTISGFRGIIASSSGPLDEVLKIFSEEDKYYVKGGNKEFVGLQDAIKFNNLTFGYASDRNVLENVDFTVKKGQMTAIVGPTGSGKSTLINLLMRYYECPENSIYLDGTDIRDFSLDSYLQHVALVSQETLLLHDSLRNNITYGLENVSEDALHSAVDSSRLGDFVELLPEGLDTLIGDRGVKLSGGEKQRVSIARALLKGSSILILDEATSSLDSKTEKLIQEAIDEAVQGRTSIVIAHRLSTIKHANKIVVIEGGEVVEEGALDDLLVRKGEFFSLWEEQKF